MLGSTHRLIKPTMASTEGEKQRLLYPSEYGYHPRSRSPTYKRLRYACEILKDFVERQEAIANQLQEKLQEKTKQTTSALPRGEKNVDKGKRTITVSDFVKFKSFKLYGNPPSHLVYNMSFSITDKEFLEILFTFIHYVVLKSHNTETSPAKFARFFLSEIGNYKGRHCISSSSSCQNHNNI